MKEDTVLRHKKVTEDSTMSLFVALYLILLGFFVILNAVSAQVSHKASEAMDSVNSTFKKKEANSNDRAQITGSMSAASQDEFLTSIQGVFLSELDIKGRFSSYGGNVLSVEIPEDFLFEGGSMRLKSTRGSLIQKLVDMVKGGRGNEYELAFLFGTGAEVVHSGMTRRQEIAIRRAGSLARLLREKGLDGGTYSTGFVPAPADIVVAVFRHRVSVGSMNGISAPSEKGGSNGT